MSSDNNTKVCKHCQTEIPKKAKVCPQCRKKQGGIMKWVLLVLVAAGFLGALAGGEGEESVNDENKTDVVVEHNHDEKDNVIKKIVKKMKKDK